MGRGRFLIGMLLVALLGMGGTILGSTLAGADTPTTWAEQSSASNPSPRSGTAMAYDSATDQLVLFGGQLLAGEFTNETWTWDGTTWTQLNPATSPPALLYASMAFDVATGQLVLCGGDSNGLTDETWTWDGTTWTQLNPETNPPNLYNPAMAYDFATGELVLFGGLEDQSGSDVYSDATWTWDGTTWTQVSPATSPPARVDSSMAYDESTGQLILFGGFNEYDSDVFLDDTWSWDGKTWTQLNPAASPSPRDGASLAYDSDLNQLVLYGGAPYQEPGPPGANNDTWTWDGNTWTEQSPAVNPGGRAFASMAMDSGTDQLVLYGGVNEADKVPALLNNTWTYGDVGGPPAQTPEVPLAIVLPAAAMGMMGGTALMLRRRAVRAVE